MPRAFYADWRPRTRPGFCVTDGFEAGVTSRSFRLASESFATVQSSFDTAYLVGRSERLDDGLKNLKKFEAYKEKKNARSEDVRL